MPNGRINGVDMPTIKNLYFVAFVALFGTAIQAATLKVRNETAAQLGIRVADSKNATWESGVFDLNPGAEQWVDSGTGTIALISWSAPSDKDYVAEVTLWNLNLGAEFIIRDNGNYEYKFGIVNGSGTGVAKVWECNGPLNCIRVPINFRSGNK